MDYLPLILTVLGSVLTIGVVWKYVGRLLNVVKEIGDFCVKIGTVMEDRTITQDEVQILIKEIKDVGRAIKAIIGK